MANRIKRIRAILGAKADARLERYETPEVLARQAVQFVEQQLASLQLQMHQAKTAEISARNQAVEAKRKAEVLKARATSRLESGDTDGAVQIMRQALLRYYQAQVLEAQHDDLRRLNETLAANLTELSEQRTIIRMQAEIEQARYAGARAAQLSAEARYGQPGVIDEAPYEKIEKAMKRSEELAASATATVELGRQRLDLSDLAATPDFTSEAKRVLGLGGSTIAELESGSVGPSDLNDAADTTEVGETSN
jgi:phage shock protein A